MSTKDKDEETLMPLVARYSFFFAVLLLGIFIFSPWVGSNQAEAVTCTSTGTNANWNSTSTWTGCTGGNGSPVNTPGTNDTAVIAAGSSVIVNVASSAAAVTLNGGGTAAVLTISNTNTLTVSGAVSINAPTGLVTNSIAVGAGALTAGSLTITGGSTASYKSQVTLTTGTITVSGDVTFGAGTIPTNQVLDLSVGTGTGTLNIAGTFYGVGTFTTGSSTVNYNSSSAQAVANYTYNNLTFTNGGATAKTLGGNVTVNGNLTINNGAALSAGAASNISINGNWTNGGAFSAGTGTVNFSGTNAQTIGGAVSTTFNVLKINNANTSGVALGGATTITTLTIGDLTSNSVFNDGGFVITPGSGSILNLVSGKYKLGSSWPAWVTSNITAGTTVEYAAAVAQTVSTTPIYQNLTFSGAGTKTTATGTLSIGGDWSLTGTGTPCAQLSTYNTTVNLTGNLTGTGTITQGTNIINIGGNWTQTGTNTLTTAGINYNNSTGLTAQTARGMTYPLLKINNVAGVTLTAAATITTLLIGDLTTGSVFSDGGFQLGQPTSITTLTLGTSGGNVGTLKLGSATTATTYPAVTTNTINTGSTVEYAAGVDQTILATLAYQKLAVSNSANTGNSKKTLGGGITVNGSLMINAGCTFDNAAGAGARIFVGAVTVNTGATWSNSGNVDITMRGGLTNYGIFTAGSGTYTFDTTAAQSISGDFVVIQNLTVTSPTVLTNNITVGGLTVSTALSGTGQLTQASSAILNIGGTSGISNLAATNSGNTVSYIGAGQTVKSTTYYKLDINSSGSATLGGNTTVNNNLTVTAGTLQTASTYTLSVSGTTNISGTLALAGSGAGAFTGAVTINSSGSWTNSGNVPATFGGGLTNNGSFAWGTGTQTFNGGGITNNTVSASGWTAGTGSIAFQNSSQSIGGTSASTIQTLTVASGITLTNSLSGSSGLTISAGLSGAGNFTQNTNAILTYNSTTSIALTGTFNANTNVNTVNYNNALAQTVKATTYKNLTLSGGGLKTLTGVTTINGNLSVIGSATATTDSSSTTTVSGDLTLNDTAALTTGNVLNVSGNLFVDAGTTLNIQGFSITVTGTTYVSGSLKHITSNAGTKTYTGLVTINDGGTWNNSINAPINFRGGLTINGTATFTQGTATYTFNTNSQTITSATTPITFANMTVGVNTVTNSVTAGGGLTVTGTLTISASSALAQGANANLNIGGTITNSGTFTADTSGNTVNYNNNGPTQTVIKPNGGTGNYNNLTLSGTGGSNAKTLPATAMTINGALTLSGTATATTQQAITAGSLNIGDGTTFTVGAFNITVSGAATIGGGASGTLALNATGARTFTGLVQVNNGAIWNNSANSAVTFRGGLTNNGTFTSGTNTYTFDTNSQSIGGANAVIFSGTIAIVGTVTVTNNGTVYANNATNSITGSVSGSTWLNNTNSTLYIAGPVLTTGILTATASGNTVNYSGAAQTVNNTNYYHLTLSGSGAKTLQTGTTTITGNLGLSGAASATAVAGLTIGGGITLNTSGTLDLGLGLSHVLSGGVTLTAGTLNCNSSTLSLAGNITGTGGTFSAGTGTVNYNGTSAPQTVGVYQYYDLKITKSAHTATLGGSITVNHNLTLFSGYLDVSSSNYALTVKGDWTNNDGATSFVSQHGTVIFNGTGTGACSADPQVPHSQTIYGPSSWYGLTISAAAARTFCFQSTKTQTVQGPLAFTGASAQLLTLAPTAGTAWLLNVSTSSTQAISYVSASYSNAGGGASIEAGNGTNADGGNNTNWLFTSAQMTVQATGTQVATLNANSQNNYVGGAFIFARNYNSANVTSISVTNTGTVSYGNLSNVKLYYKQESTCETSFPTTGSTQFGSTASFNTSNVATFNGTMSVGTSPVCVYVKLDVLGTANNGDTIDIKIQNSSDVVVSNGGVTYSPGLPLDIQGTTTIVTGATAPTLTSGAVNPALGDTRQTYSFTVVYTDAENDPPDTASGYPKIYIGDADGSFGYTMSPDTGAGGALHDLCCSLDNTLSCTVDLDCSSIGKGTCVVNYTNGEQYKYTADLGAAADIRYHFETKAATGNTILVSTTAATGPTVILLYGKNLAGVPKNLGAGMSYYSVLGDDSGYLWCQAYVSTGLYSEGPYSDCSSSNLLAGRSYWIWALAGNYQLDGPAGAGNNTAAYYDVSVQAGWNLVSNPYTGRIPLCNISGSDCLDSGPRVNVVRNGSEYDFGTAVINGWVNGTIYEYRGTVTGYYYFVYNGTPPAVLEPWKGYWLYVSDASYPVVLRIYRSTDMK